MPVPQLKTVKVNYGLISSSVTLGIKLRLGKFNTTQKCQRNKKCLGSDILELLMTHYTDTKYFSSKEIDTFVKPLNLHEEAIINSTSIKEFRLK